MNFLYFHGMICGENVEMVSEWNDLGVEALILEKENLMILELLLVLR